MLVKDRPGRALRAWHWVAAVAAVTILLAAYAAPISAAASKTTLSSASVSPRIGTTRTDITVTVVYRNDKSSRAENVTVYLGTDHHGMKQVPGGDWGHGVTFRWSGTVKEGTQKVVITARGRDKSEARLEAGTVKITKATKGATPPPTAAPTPVPTPRATPKPTPKPTAKPVVRSAPRATPRPTRKPAVIARPVAQIAPIPTPAVPAGRDSEEPVPVPTGQPITAVLGGLAAVGPGGPDGGGPGAGAGPGGSGGGPGGANVPTNPRGSGGSGGGSKEWGPIAGLFAAVGFSAPTFPPMALAPTLVTTSGAVATAMAFGLFGRRRRDDDEIPDDVLAAAAASGMAVGPAQLVGVATPIPFPASEIGAGGVGGAGGAGGDRPAADGRPVQPVDPTTDEMLMPRWRRPSLIQARKADPIRDNTPAPRLTFGQGFVGPLAGRERRVIRYRVVRLLDSPDELRGAEIGYLDQGDEVQLLEKYGAYWLVASPDGQQGWLHKMVLGEIVEADGAPPADLPVATMPTVADSWTMGESDIDSDVFDAYLQARRREA